VRTAATSARREARRLALQAERLEGYVAAGIRLQEAGVPVSSYSLQREAGGSCATANAYLSRVLEIVAVRGARREALVTAFRGILAHWRMPHLWTATQAGAPRDALACWERLTSEQVERIWLRKRFDAREECFAAADPANAARARELVYQDEEAWQTLCAEWTLLEPANRETDGPPEMTREEWEESEFAIWWHDLGLPEATAMACAALGMLHEVAEPRDGPDRVWTSS
jgi:hypothetical protein